jgi:hypothetical protein
MALACVALLVWFWPRLIDEGMTVPVTLYIAVLGGWCVRRCWPGCPRLGPRWAQCASRCPTG